jgi:hypothetical protein
MKAIWGLGLTYISFGLFIYGRYLDNDWGKILKAAFTGVKHRPGLYWYIAAAALLITGAILIIHTGIKARKK